MDSIEFFQVSIIINILIITLFYMYFRSLTSSSAAAADTDIPPLQEKYDVFISFRGEDTRLTFTSHLYEALRTKNIDTYIDYRLVRGGEIAPALLEAIQRSALSVIIFSKNYASSTWCLDELVHILECKEKNSRLVIPIFYDISPSDVRKQHGSYALAFRQLEKRFRDSIDKVHKWRAALTQAANLSGFDDSEKTESEASLVKKVVQDIWTKLNSESSSDLKGLFGIGRKIEQIESLLCLDSTGVCCVGIWGMGGIGKTTLADAVFHRQFSKFEAACFLANVRENSEQTNGLHQLRNKLVGEILKEKDVNIDTPTIPLHIQDRLRRTKALIVLDDVNARKQLEDLVGDHDKFCQGSQIIITARDKGILEQKVDHAKIFHVEGLGSDEALQLFHSHAFGNKSPTIDYTELSSKVVDYIKGIPLSLKVMGSSFRRCKSKQEWEVQWKKVKRVPIGEIQKVLRVSYDGLEDNEKEIFLDIACFHKGYERNDVKELLDSCDFHGEAGINDLIDRSLISISQGRIEMHDLVQEMGLSIVREQRIEERSRLVNAEDVYQVLTNNQVSLELSLKNLVSLPTNIWKLKSLVSLDLSRCSKFQNFPEISEAMEHLEFLNLSGTAVKVLPPSIGNLVALRKLDLGYCKNLEVIPDDLFCLTSLEELNLSSTKIKSIPASIKQVAQLSRMCLRDCMSLASLPELPPLLQCLEADGCTSLKTVSRSSTAITQGWEEYIFSRGLLEKHIFSDCPKLDENARSNIMADAQLRIMRMANASKFKEDKIEEKIEKELFDRRYLVAIKCPGYEIPKWFSHQSEGSSIKIELPCGDWFSTDFLGFALSLAYKRYAGLYMTIGCKYNFKTSNGEIHEVNHFLSEVLGSLEEYSLEVFVSWYNVFEEVVEEARSPTAFYNRFTEVNVDFNVQPFPAEKCGICLLYGKDAEKIKQRALYGQDA